MQKQVDKAHYQFQRYMRKPRWASVWHQLDEVIRLQPSRVLEIGPGPGIFKAVMHTFGVSVETLDVDPELHPDHIASVMEMPFEAGAYDVVCAFQMLEHLPFEQSLRAFREMVRVSDRGVVISLPDADARWPISFQLPKLGRVDFSVLRPKLRAPVHQFDGEHYWEINKRGFSLAQVTRSFVGVAPVVLDRTYRVPEKLGHRFFVFEKIHESEG